jgi:hypothetical protein
VPGLSAIHWLTASAQSMCGQPANRGVKLIVARGLEFDGHRPVTAGAMGGEFHNVALKAFQSSAVTFLGSSVVVCGSVGGLIGFGVSVGCVSNPVILPTLT